MKTDKISIARVREMLAYDPATGVLTWKMRPAPNSRRKIGDVAGTVWKNGYRYIGLDGNDCLAQRLVWAIHYNEWPKHIVRFIDGDVSNCRIVNLRDTVELTPGVKFNHRTKEGRAAYGKAARKASHDRFRAYDLKRSFGITLEDYQRLFVEQSGACAICEKPETEKRGGEVKWLAVDHDHETGDVRGLLCCACNQGIGKLGDSPDLLRRAARYLERKKTPVNVVPLKAAEGA